MSIQIIPDKICPHCGGNKWYYRSNGKNVPFKYECYKKEKERKDIKNLSDSYIRTCIESYAIRNGYRRKSSEITQKEIEINRIHFIKIRTKNQEIMKRIPVTTKDMTPEERTAVYNKKYNEKKKLTKLNSVKEYENLVSLGEESISKIEEPVVSSSESIIDEFKRIELRRNEILNQVEILNNYIESLKIKLV